jgi:hypothetical protein
LVIAGLLAGLSFTVGRSLLGSPLPVFVPSALGTALVGGLAAVLAGFGLRSPVPIVLVASVALLYGEATSLRPAVPSLLSTWPTVASLVIVTAGIEYGLRRDRSRPVRRSTRSERALLGGGLAAFLALIAFSLRGVGPITVFLETGPLSVSTLGAVLSAFGPPAMLVWASVAVVLRYGLLAPLASLPAVGALLANPQGFAFSLFTAASPLVFAVVFALAAGEYVLRVRLSSFRPRSLVG